MVVACGGQGPENPVQDLFLAYQVLGRLGNNSYAHTALEEAWNLMIKRANNIQEPELRDSFLENVPINRAICEAAQAKGWGKDTR